MKRIILISLLAFGPFAKAQYDDCQYYVDKSSIKVGWSAYKTTAKVGVDGHFKSPKLLNSESRQFPRQLIENAKFEINGVDFDAGNSARNKNIRDHFFKLFADQAKITGRVKKMGKKAKGQLDLELTMNGVTKTVPMTYDLAGSQFSAKGQIDVMDFALGGALAALNKACFDLHKGSDGVSKTWSTVDVSASSRIRQECL